ncbi:hypothetical protein JTE90_012294 [Oedothorax gibbosus]|uniref:Uncharacterized protein n=1 Tax=Oedothorax gibbosus TaxID=931172 RepID=A0AAV6VK06_9ARAC|nr:hypothetical protein JTE90_012294 [Oedothorax gibbosus]
MREKFFHPGIFTLTGFLLLYLVENAWCRPKVGRGGGRGSSIALYGGRGYGSVYLTSARWAVLSPATKVLIIIFCIILGIFLLVGAYKMYVWCIKDPGRR